MATPIEQLQLQLGTSGQGEGMGLGQATGMSDLPVNPTPSAPPALGEQGEELSIPDQKGMIETGERSKLSGVPFEDYFPNIDLGEEEESALVEWFDRDLRSCVRHVNSYVNTWATYRAVYMLEYIEKFYPDLGIGADYSSGLLCEKILEGMDRMKKAISSSYPLFVPHVRRTGSAMDVEFLDRAQWFLDTILQDDLDIMEVIKEGALFDFITDGSAILEADTIYERVPQRTLKTYADTGELAEDEGKALSSSHYDRALRDLLSKGVARMLIEQDIVTKDGMQLFYVDKVDHLVPEGVYSDRDIRFRARRMYYTSSDLRLLSSDDVNWYDKNKVEELIEGRQDSRQLWRLANQGNEAAIEALKVREENADLSYDWKSEEGDLTDTSSQPYKDVFAVYRVLCKYAYRTKKDPKGKIPKYCLFDYSPEGRSILRSVTYPHFHERPNWFHMKLGYAPKSYYGFGYGARLIQDDFLESNAVDLFLDGAAFATFKPQLFRHPEAGGMYPWHAGYGPGKVGYVNDVHADYKDVDIRPPSDAMLRHLLPLTANRSANRTSITSLVQGRTESSDPRSPAAKTAMLLNQASVGLDVMVDDWNTSGWNKLANYVWAGQYEMAIYIQTQVGEDAEISDLIVQGEVPIDAENIISLEELKRNIKWISNARSSNLNAQVRMQQFLQAFQFFVPLLKEMAEFKPDLYKKYFLRWMRRAGQEIDIPGMVFLMPTLQEIQDMPNDKLAGVMDNIVGSIQGAQGPQSVETGGAQRPPAARANR